MSNTKNLYKAASRMAALTLLLLSAMPAKAQREVFKGQVMAHGGVYYFTDTYGVDKTPNAYGAGLRLMGNLGKSWLLGASYMENRYWDNPDKGQSLATLSLGYGWDNGYLLYDRAFLSPYHLLEVGYFSQFQSGDEGRFRKSQGVFGLENGLKFRLGDRWSARLGLGMYWRAENERFDGLFAKDFEYGYKAGLSFYFGERKSKFRGPVFNAGRDFERRRTMMRVIEEKQVDLLSPSLSPQLQIREKPRVDTLTVQRPETIVSERIDTTFATVADTLFLLGGDTLYQLPKIAASGVDLVDGDSLLATADDSLRPPVADTLFASRTDTLLKTVRDTLTHMHTDTLYLVNGDTLNPDAMVGVMEEIRQSRELLGRMAEEAAIAERDTSRENSVQRQSKAAGQEPNAPSDTTVQDEVSEGTDDLLRRQNKLIETQNELIRAMLQRDSAAQLVTSDRSQMDESTGKSTETTSPHPTNITIVQPEQDKKFKPRLEVVPQVAIPLGGGKSDRDDEGPSRAELMARIDRLEAQVNQLLGSDTAPLEVDTTSALNATLSRDYLGNAEIATVETESDSLPITGRDTAMSAPTTSPESMVLVPDSLPADTTVETTLKHQPADDSLKGLKPDSATINESARADSVYGGTTVLKAKYPVGILFGLNQVNFEAKYRAPLDMVADDLKAHTALKVVLTGYTDNSGQASYNLALSKKRAEAVKTYLTSKGISADRISILAEGQGQATKTYDQNERRVDIRLE